VRIVVWTIVFIAVAIHASAQTDTPATAPADFNIRLAAAAVTLTRDRVVYDPTYFNIPYPMGDVPADKGVCTDVVIRAYRKLNIDLQQLVHEDMAAHFDVYPKRWGLRKPDTNIDHRRVPNLMTFFTRKGQSITVTQKAKDYLPGDLVTWDLGHGITHIGVVSDKVATDPDRMLIVHNIGAGQVLADCLFQFPITGHYRYRKNR
jgi:uncharacterized protein YijF (DUF1287 family)